MFRLANFFVPVNYEKIFTLISVLKKSLNF